MQTTYSSYVSEAQAIGAACLRELRELARQAKLSPRVGGLMPSWAQQGQRALNRMALANGLIGHGQARDIIIGLRSSLPLLLSDPEGNFSIIMAALDCLDDIHQALDPQASYAELVLASGLALRPPLKRRLDLSGICQDLSEFGMPISQVFDGQGIAEEPNGKFRLSLSPESVSPHSGVGSTYLFYFDVRAAEASLAPGLTEIVEALYLAISEGKVLRYGNMDMRYESLLACHSILPAYAIARLSHPGSQGELCLPGLKLIMKISADNQGLVNADTEPGPGPDTSAFIVQGPGPKTARNMDPVHEPTPKSVGAHKDKDAIGLGSEDGGIPAADPTEKADTNALAADEVASAPEESPDSLEVKAPPLDVKAPPLEEKAPPLEEKAPSSEEEARPNDGLRPLHAPLPEGIDLPEIKEEEGPGFSLSDFNPNDIQGLSTQALPATPPKPIAKTPPTPPRADAKDDEADIAPAAKGHADRSFIRVPISVKMIGIISVLIVLALGVMTILSSYFFRREIQNQLESAGLQIADATRQKFDADFIELSGYAQRIIQGKKTSASEGQALVEQGDVLMAASFPSGQSSASVEVFNQAALADLKIGQDEVRSALESAKDSLLRAQGGEAVCQNISPAFNEPTLLAAWPYSRDEERGALALIFTSRTRLQAGFEGGKKGINQVYLLSDHGEVLAHPDSSLVSRLANFASKPFFKPLSQGKFLEGGIPAYRDDDGQSYQGSYAKLRGMGAIVVVMASQKKSLEAVERVVWGNVFITLMIVAVAILLVYFFAKTISLPIQALVGASQQIREGSFSVRLRPRAHDELGLLTTSFVEMAGGLAERERLKESFGRFVNKEIAEQASKGTLKIGGERKRVTVFFSDIRGFTAISEQLEPEEVVEFLNAYMTRMVRCVNDTGGVVDKFIGDAIMAVWGAPLAHGNDAENALNAALMMRRELMDFNRDRGGPRRPIIHIGCGINSGPAIAGQIGSNERMEYTVIGDTVNLASRTEALNKPFGTDILITQDSYDQVRDIFRVEAMKPIKVKGKAESQQIYAVLGRFDDPLCPDSLAELQVRLGIQGRDIQAVDVNSEEVKYEILEPADQAKQAGDA